jgi:uncharacterized protein DUF6636
VVVWLAAVVAFGVAIAVTASRAAASPSVVLAFRTPSGNIGCVYSSSQPDELRCDIRSRLRHPKPVKPRGCTLDWGDSLFMTPTGRAKLTCHGDTAIIPGSRKIPYGTSWRHGGFVCASKTIGLRCHNRAGHGFFLSRQRWSRF